MRQQPEPQKHDFDFTDVLAFTIAAFQILLPVIAGLIGVALVVYLALRLLAR